MLCVGVVGWLCWGSLERQFQCSDRDLVRSLVRSLVCLGGGSGVGWERGVVVEIEVVDGFRGLISLLGRLGGI